MDARVAAVGLLVAAALLLGSLFAGLGQELAAELEGGDAATLPNGTIPSGIPTPRVTSPTGVTTVTQPSPNGNGPPSVGGTPSALPPLTAGSAGGAIGGSSDGVPLPQTAAPKFGTDRNGAASGDLVCYAAFDPDVGCLKRWMALDVMGPKYEMSKSSVALSPVALGLGRGDIVGSFPVVLSPDAPTPIFSWSPKQVVLSLQLDPPAPGVRLMKDATDTYYLQGPASGTRNVTILLRDESGYRNGIPDGVTLKDIAITRSAMPPAERASVAAFLRERGLEGTHDVSFALRDLQAFFSGFGEGEISPDEPDFFKALVESKVGCCRHRALGFVAAAQTLGVPARFVYNEAHAFAEVDLGAKGWVLVNLGGCGGTTTRGAEGKTPYAAPPTTSARLIPTITEVTSLPPRVSKNERLAVEGTVLLFNGSGAPRVPVTLFLNETKTAPGREVGRAVTDGAGSWRAELAIPSDLPVRDYQFVARHDGGSRYQESWSDPPIAIVDGSRLKLDVPPKVMASAPVPIQIHLTDEHGVNVPNATIHIAYRDDPATAEDVKLGPDGRATLAHAFGVRARHVEVVATFAGSDHLESARANATVRVFLLTYQAHLPLDLVRGEAANLSGALFDHATPLDDHPVLVRAPWGATNGTTGINPPPTMPPGPVELRLESVDPPGLVATIPSHVRIRATLSATWPGAFLRDSTPDIPLFLRDDQDQGVPFAALGDAGVATDQAGRAAFRIPSGVSVTQSYLFVSPQTSEYTRAALEVNATPVTLVAKPRPLVAGEAWGVDLSSDTPGIAEGSWPGLDFARVEDARASWDSATLSFDLSSAEARVVTLTTDLPGYSEALVIELKPPTPWWVLWVALAVVALAGVGVAAWKLARKRRPEMPPAMVALKLREPVVIRVVNAELPEGLPFAAEPAQPLGVAVTATPHVDELRWSYAGQTGVLRLLAGAGTLALVAPKGDHALVVQHDAGYWKGLVRVATWDEQVSRDYESLKALAPTLPRGATPRVVQAALTPSLDLDRAILAFEKSAYSPAFTTREDWIDFARALLRLGART